MPQITRTFFLLFLLMGWSLPISLQSLQAKETSVQISIAIPAASLDLSDLDLRDKDNRKIESPAAVQQMKNLFVTGLNNLLTFNLTPSIQFLRDMMVNSWNVFCGTLSNTIQHAIQKFEAWWPGKKQQVAHRFLSLLTLSSSRDLSPHFFGLTSVHLTHISSIISSTQILR